MIMLGAKVRDRITLFFGTATARCEYLGGMAQVRVETFANGKVSEQWFDASRLEAYEGDTGSLRADDATAATE